MNSRLLAAMQYTNEQKNRQQRDAKNQPQATKDKAQASTDNEQQAGANPKQTEAAPVAKPIAKPHSTPVAPMNSMPTDQPSLPQSDITKVNVTICGTHHRLTCPAEGVNALNAAVDAINDAIKGLRRQVRGKSPSNEEMLALYCLGLYDELQNAKADLERSQRTNEAIELHLDKLIQDAKQAMVG